MRSLVDAPRRPYRRGNLPNALLAAWAFKSDQHHLTPVADAI